VSCWATFLGVLALSLGVMGARAEDKGGQVCHEQGDERPLFTIDEEDATYPPPIPRAWTTGRSVGAPNAGLLLGGVRLPRSGFYVCRSAVTCVGSASTVEALLRAIIRYQRRMGGRAALRIGDISREGGGALREHKSHQSGRDVDITIPRRAGEVRTGEIDWEATALLVESLAEEGAVDAIFLHYDHQAELVRRSGRRMSSFVQWRPGVEVAARVNAGLVRHAPGHEGHMHVRFRCGADEDDCLPNPIGDVHIE
jgi:murein endopeptidase